MNFHTRTARKIAALVIAVLVSAGFTAVAAPAHGDITWGRTEAPSAGKTTQAKDITWGRSATSSAVQTPQAKDITWGKLKAPRWPGAEVSHITDDGFDDPWSMYCYNGLVFHLYEGQWSKNQCADVTHISVLAGRQVVCWDRTGDRRVYPPGVHYISGGTTYLRCVHQLA